MTRWEIAATCVMVLVIAGTSAVVYELGFRHGHANGRAVENLRWSETNAICHEVLVRQRESCDPAVRYVTWCPVWVAEGCDDPLDPHCGEDRD